MMQKIRCVMAPLALAAVGCKTTGAPPVVIPPAGTVLDNGRVGLVVVATTVLPGVRAVQFARALAGVVGTADGKLYQTSDGGRTWALRCTNPPVGQPLAAAAAYDCQRGLRRGWGGGVPRPQLRRAAGPHCENNWWQRHLDQHLASY